MNDPKRLMDSEVGLAQDILHAASRQTASDSALQNVLQIVDLALEQKAAGSRETGTHAQPSTRSLQSSAPLARYRSKPRAPVRAWVRFGLALEVSTLVPIGVAMAAGIGGTVLVTRVIEHVQSIAPEPIESAASAAQQKQRKPSKAAPRVNPEAPQPSLDVPPVEANGSSRLVAPASLSYEDQAASARLQAEDLAWSKSSSPVRLPSPAADREGDWLGEQFAMIGNARRILEAGNPAEALEILEDYARRFPEGTLGHQVAELRSRASETGATLGLLDEFDFGI
jgi:hypothetical protein